MAFYSQNLEQTIAGPMSLVIGAILIIPTSIILVDCIKILYLTKTDEDVQELNNYFRHSTLSAVITYFLSILISYPSAIWLCVNHDQYKPTEKILFFMSTSFYFAGRWIMLLLFVFRIDFSFRGSILKYSNKVLYPMYVMVFLMPGLIIIMLIGSFTSNTSGTDYGPEIRMLCAICWILIEFLLSIILIILFLSRLFHLFNQRAKFCFANMKATSSNSMSNASNKSQSPVPVTTTETTIVSLEKIYMITKYSLLVITSILSSFFTIIIALLVFNRTFFYYMLALVDACINIICLYLFLNYKTPKRIYACICQHAHSICSKCCIYCLSFKNHLRYEECQGVIVNM